MADSGSLDQNFSGATTDSLGISGSNLGAGLSAVGSLVGAFGTFQAGQANAAADQAAAKGYEEESQAYTQAAGYAQGNVQLAEESTAIQQYQQQRALTKSLGATKAEVAGAGFSASGTGLDLLRGSMAQGALATGLIGVQGAITSQGYAAQSAADTALSNEASAAEAAAKAAASSASSGGIIGALGGVLGGVAKIAPLFFA